MTKWSVISPGACLLQQIYVKIHVSWQSHIKPCFWLDGGTAANQKVFHTFLLIDMDFNGLIQDAGHSYIAMAHALYGPSAVRAVALWQQAIAHINTDNENAVVGLE